MGISFSKPQRGSHTPIQPTQAEGFNTPRVPRKLSAQQGTLNISAIGIHCLQDDCYVTEKGCKQQSLVNAYKYACHNLLNPDLSKQLCDVIEETRHGASMTFNRTFNWRKKVMYEQNRQAIMQHHYEQIVLFADGVNPMVVALASEFPKTQFYCTDIDSRLVTERQRVLTDYFALPNIHCVTHDAREAYFLFDVFTPHGFEDNAASLANMENISFFFSPKERDELIRSFLSMNPSNRILINFIDEDTLLQDEHLTEDVRVLTQIVQEYVSESANVHAVKLGSWQSHLQVNMTLFEAYQPQIYEKIALISGR